MTSDQNARERIAEAVLGLEVEIWDDGYAVDYNHGNTDEVVNEILAIVREALLSEEAINYALANGFMYDGQTSEESAIRAALDAAGLGERDG